MIPRHKTAIRRPDLSLPVKCLPRDGLLDSSKRLFDYGCGHGKDIGFLAEMGIPCDGWDPYYRGETTKTQSPIINLGYVLNVIEDPAERAEVLQQAWELCDEVLVVSAIGLTETAETEGRTAYNDGVLTSRGTFQKHYGHQELRAYLQDLLPVEAVPAAPNIFYLFKDESAQQQHLASRYRRPAAVPELSLTLRVFEGCARAIAGEIDGANVVKLHRYSGKVTYLVCRGIEEDTNPEVALRVKVNLRTLAIDFFDYSARLNVDLAVGHEESSS